MLKIKITTIISILTCATSLLSAPRNQRPKSRPFRLYSQSIQAPTPPTSPLHNQLRASTDHESIQSTALSPQTLLALANATTQNTTIVPIQTNQFAEQAASQPGETIVPQDTTTSDQPVQALENDHDTSPRVKEISSAFLSVEMPRTEQTPTPAQEQTPAQEPSAGTALSRLRSYLSFF